MAQLRAGVVMTTYNGAKYLPTQLESLATQTRPPDELLVSDDGSSDETLRILEDFAKKASFPVRVHRQPKNLGPNQNYSVALELADADVLLCCDQDDVWHDDKIDRVMDVFASRPEVGLVLNDANLVAHNADPLHRTLWQQYGFDAVQQDKLEAGSAFEVFARVLPVYGCTMAVRAALRPLFLPVPHPITFDAWIADVVAVSAPCRLIREPLQDYRQHAAQVTGFEGGCRLTRALRVVTRSNVQAVVKEIERFQPILARLKSLPDTPARSAAERLIHERLGLARARLAARRSLIRRVPLIARYLLNGSYHRSARGLLSATVDLLAKPERLL